MVNSAAGQQSSAEGLPLPSWFEDPSHTYLHHSGPQMDLYTVPEHLLPRLFANILAPVGPPLSPTIMQALSPLATTPYEQQRENEDFTIPTQCFEFPLQNAPTFQASPAAQVITSATLEAIFSTALDNPDFAQFPGPSSPGDNFGIDCNAMQKLIEGNAWDFGFNLELGDPVIDGPHAHTSTPTHPHPHTHTRTRTNAATHTPAVTLPVPLSPARPHTAQNNGLKEEDTATAATTIPVLPARMLSPSPEQTSIPATSPSISHSSISSSTLAFTNTNISSNTSTNPLSSNKTNQDNSTTPPKARHNSWTTHETSRLIVHFLSAHAEGARYEARFDIASERLRREGIERTATAVKNQWNRVGRERSGFDERRKKMMRDGRGRRVGRPLATSRQVRKGGKR